MKECAKAQNEKVLKHPPPPSSCIAVSYWNYNPNPQTVDH